MGNKKTFNGTRKLFIEPGNMGNKEKPENIGNKEIFNGTRKLFIEPGNMRKKKPFMKQGNILWNKETIHRTWMHGKQRNF